MKETNFSCKKTRREELTRKTNPLTKKLFPLANGANPKLMGAGVSFGRNKAGLHGGAGFAAQTDAGREASKPPGIAKIPC
jgi:hypothetical protein